ncbi:MAG: hypothetical protein MJ134_00175 [Lachnospiraceae bacterium]|nr:hypothetical protein [Lachnospiraceae bacterium]
MKSKKWFAGTIGAVLSILFLIGLPMIIIDPYFHFHGPIPGFSYRLYSERYMNDGIVRHFDYDAIITGSSMNQNFKTSTMDSLFGTNSIKVPFSGAGFQEISNLLERALSTNPDIKYVLWGIDYNGFNREYDWAGYDDYPDYLYDDNPLNDFAYIWNKTILYEALITDVIYTLKGNETTTFDEYSSWEVGGGWDQIRKTYYRSDEVLPMEPGLSEGAKERVQTNIGENIVKLVKKYPNTQFLFFYTPYSALYWESLTRDGTFWKQLEAEKLTTEMLLDCPNVSLYSFAQMTDITGNVMNYRDKEHYVAAINEKILHWIADGEGLVTKENYEELLQWELEYYTDYDYDELYTTYVP